MKVKNCIVIIPTYNEIENIEGIIKEVLCLTHKNDSVFDILIVDDGSPDGTANKVKELQKEFPNRILLEERQGKLGLGTAYIHGFKIALQMGYEYICEMDADFSHRPVDLLQLYLTCKQEKKDLAIGSRYSNGVTVINWPIGRVLMSYFASWYVRFITGMPIMDTTAGFKCYHRKVLETIELDQIKFIGYAFQIEMKFLAWKYGFSITEVPIIFQDRTKGVSKMSTKIFNEAFLGVIQMKLRSLFRTFHRKS
ncbi:dolichol-phosphate mannosyltransferase [Thermoflexibacter ruber]|uniref:Dolichol-phosphate mannosyltransferase n=1 Tax=Thermoflexibacter ruber TaxID=1003 RepID=A0A1I2A7C6_9BACT|nr:dolichol-phosphate mannosyltransferase [Thermoflexibacter ruber]